MTVMNCRKTTSGTQAEYKEFFALTPGELLVATALAFRSRGWSNIQTVGFGLTASLQIGFEDNPFLAVVTCLAIQDGVSELMLTMFTSAADTSMQETLDALLVEVKTQCFELSNPNMRG